MLITDQFVFVHLPKTGGMFVDGVMKELLVPSKVLRKVHSLRSRYGIRIPGVKYHYFSFRRHAACDRIPEWARDLRICGTIRSPYDWYVSNFKFDIWKNERTFGKLWEAESRNELVAVLPNFPDLSFEEFVHAVNRHWRIENRFSDCALTNTLGVMTKDFLRCFCHDRVAVYDGDEAGLVERAQKHLYPVTFLRQANLNKDLSAFLKSQNFADGIVDAVKARDRIYPGKATRPKGESWHAYFNEELKAFVRHRERLIFSLFPEFDE